MYIKTEGIVLRSVIYKDSDAILTLFTKKMGKISVYAKNVRKLNHSSMASSQVFAYGIFQLKVSEKMMNLVSFDLKENYYSLTGSIDRTFLAYYMAELTEQVLIENQTNNRLFFALISCLDSLKTSNSFFVIKVFYQIKVLFYFGVKPEVSKCITCGIDINSSVNFYFHMQDGGLCCENCLRKFERDAMCDTYDYTTYRLLEYMAHSGIGDVLEARISRVLLAELSALIERYYLLHLPDLRVKSEEFIRHLKP